MHFTENFFQVLQDYIFLLEKKYPEKTVLEMVSKRYSLIHFERSMLYRGITIQETATRRKNKLITIEPLNHRTLHIDLFNVLFTIAANLRGYPVYVANDGIIATSDSTIIDKSTLPVLDLPAFIIRKSFHKEILSLADQ